MASNEQIVNAPVVGGLDVYTDGNNLKPPALNAADNVTMRHPGSLEKRNGFSLVVGTGNQPASAFDGDTVPSPDVEALGANESSTGERALLAAGSKLYEYVGADASHGWRTVNRLPEHVGTLNAVTSSGGSITEIDSIPSPDGDYIFTAWISGARTGQELSSDLAYANMTTAAYNAYGNILYYSVQKTEDGSFVVPPTVLQENTTNPLLNLRLTKLWTSASKYHVIAAWQNGGSIQYKMYNFASITLSALQTLGTTGQTCFRAFDVTGLRRSVCGVPAIVWSSCPVDTSGVAPAGLYAAVEQIDQTTGVHTFLADVPNIMAKAAPGAGTWYEAWAFRGIVLEQDPDGADIAAASRAITQYYSAPATATGKLDGQLWTVLLTAGFGSLTVSAKNAQIPGIGFQTQDNHDSVLATVIGTTNVTDSVQMLAPYNTQATWLSIPLTPPNNLFTPYTLTGQLPDGTFQTYVCSTSATAVKTGPTTLVWYLALTITDPNVAGYTPTLNQSIYGPAPAFPTPTHTYPQDAPVPITLTSDQQITVIDITGIAAGLTGFTPGIHTGCPVYAGAAIICYVSVYVNPAGNVTEVAIEDGLPGVVPPAGSPDLPTAITSITIPRAGPFVWPAGGNAYSHIYGSSGPIEAMDIPSRTVRTTNTQYVVDGEIEHCVHRWDVKSSSGVAYIALSSVSANTTTTPNGDEPFGAAAPQRSNNMFEVYRWDQSSDRLLVNWTGSITSNVMVGALGGPWRLVGGLIKGSANQLYCAVCPGGDEYQRNTFLMRINMSSSFSVRFPASGKVDPGAEDCVYEDNPGLFVESCNMMRVTSAPLNMPSIRTLYSVGMSLAALRDGSSRGTQDLFNISYRSTPEGWRKLIQLSDYTFINGGTLSIFDGANSYEATSLMWPQRDLTSVNWPIVSPDVYIVTLQGSQANVQNTFSANTFYDRSGTMGKDAYCVVNVTRAWFKYEAGLDDKNGFNNPNGCGWGYIKTFWGGEPAKNYETVYADPRVAQYNFSKASYSNGWNGANTEKQHYYGRYQDTPRSFKQHGGTPDNLPFGIPNGGTETALYLWAPRAAPGWGNLACNIYNPASAGGDFLMRWTYEYTDGTGRIVRSAPSNATQYTVCAEIQGDWYNSGTSGTGAPDYTGGIVTQFKWGFFAPRLEVTNRLKTAASDAQRVSLQPYTTAEPYSTVLYRMPLSSWSSPSASFVVNRNQTRGVVPNTLTPYAASNPLGYVIDNFSLFDGPQKDYNGLISEPFLYTTGNVLDNVPPPSALAMCIHQNRLVMGGADDPTVIWFSKELGPTEAPGFNDALTIQLNDGGAVTGLASIESALIVFKSDDIFVIAGTMPDSTGYGPSLSTPLKLPSGIGCVDHRSVIETPVGVFFQSKRTIELLKSGFEVEPVGLKFTGLNGFDTATISSVSHSPETQEVYFTYYFGDEATTVAEVAVFNYGLMAWMRWRISNLAEQSGSQNIRLAVINGKPAIACRNTNTVTASEQAFYYTQNAFWSDRLQGGTYSFVPITLGTAPFSMHEVQGYERLKRASVLTTFEYPGAVKTASPAIALYIAGPQPNTQQQITNWSASDVQSLTSSVFWDGRFETHVAEQKNRALILAFTEDPATAGSADNPNISVSGFAFRIGLKAGFDKRTTSEARR